MFQMKISRFILAYLFLSLLFVICVFTSQLIPSKYIHKNVCNSLSFLENKYGISERIPKMSSYSMDVFTDALMLNIAYASNSEKPLLSSMECSFYYEGKNVVPLSDIRKLVYEGKTHLVKEDYNRYWHGYLFFLRPMLYFCSYSTMAKINYCLFFVLIIWLCVILYKYSWTYVPAFLASLFVFDFASVPLSFFFSINFYIAFVGSIVVSRVLWFHKNTTNLYLLFFVIGAFTSFFDLFSNPFVTFGLSFIFYGLAHHGEVRMKTLFSSFTVWIIGYALLWFTKWIIGGFVTGDNIIANGIHQALIRSSGSVNEFSRFDFLLSICTSKLLVLFLLLFLIIVFSYQYNKVYFRKWSWLVLLILLPLVWYFAIFEHSLRHIHFTLRIWVVSLFGISLLVMNLLKNAQKDS